MKGMKLKIQRIITFVIFLIFSFIFCNYSFGQTNMIVYGENGQGLRYRTLTLGATYWGAEGSIPGTSAYTPNFIRLISCPTRDEKISAFLCSNNTLYVSTWTSANGWAQSPTTICQGSNSSPRWFDIVYEQNSGNAMIVYSTGTGVLAYRTWNGSSWSSRSSVGNSYGTSTTIYWIRLAAKPNSNEILMACCNSNRGCYARVWNGSSCGNSYNVNEWTITDAPSTYEGFAVVYEQSSGDGLLMYWNANNSSMEAVTWNGTSWSGPTTSSSIGYPRGMDVKARPNSDEIMVVCDNNSASIISVKWTGSSWGTSVTHYSAGGTPNYHDVDSEWEYLSGHEGHCTLAARYISTERVVTRHSSDGSSWTTMNDPLPGTSGATFRNISLVRLLNSATIYLIANNSYNLYSWRWSVEASSWIAGSMETLETSLASGPDNPRQPFCMSAGIYGGGGGGGGAALSTTTILCYGDNTTPSYAKFRSLLEGSTYWTEEMITGTTIPQLI